MDSKQQKEETDPPEIDTIPKRELESMLSKGVNPSDTEERLNQLVHWRIQEYTLHKWKDLSDIFAEEFELFVKEDFKKLSKDNICGLRDCLRTNGVYVQKGRGISIAQALANVVQEDIPWPKNDEEEEPLWLEDDEERPPPKQSQSYHPPQQQLVQPQQPYQPIVEDTTPVHPPPTPIVDTTPVHPPPTPIVEDITPVQPPPTPSDGPPHQPQQQPMQSIQQQQPEDTTALPPPPTTDCGPDYRIPHLLPSPYQVIQDSSPVNTSQLSAVSRPRTISTLREPTFSLSNLDPPFASQHAHFLAPLFASQHAHFLASWLASPLDYIRDTEERKATGQG